MCLGSFCPAQHEPWFDQCHMTRLRDTSMPLFLYVTNCQKLLRSEDHSRSEKLNYIGVHTDIDDINNLLTMHYVQHALWQWQICILQNKHINTEQDSMNLETTSIPLIFLFFMCISICYFASLSEIVFQILHARNMVTEYFSQQS